MAKTRAYLVSVNSFASVNSCGFLLLFLVALSAQPIMTFRSEELALVVDAFASSVLAVSLRIVLNGATKKSFLKFCSTRMLVATQPGAQENR